VQIKLRYVNAFRNRNRRDQQARYYFRRRGQAAIRLPGLPGSEEFMAAYAAAIDSMPDQSVEIGAKRTLPGTVNALVVNYCGQANGSRLSRRRRRPAAASSNASAFSTATSVSLSFSASTS
jgi:hypothetical protein